MPAQYRRDDRAGEVTKVRLLSQNLFHNLPLCQLVDQLVQIANFPHYGFIDVFQPDTTDHPLDRSASGVQAGGFCKEGFKIRPPGQVCFNSCWLYPVSQLIIVSTSAFVRPFLSALAI